MEEVKRSGYSVAFTCLVDYLEKREPNLTDAARGYASWAVDLFDDVLKGLKSMADMANKDYQKTLELIDDYQNRKGYHIVRDLTEIIESKDDWTEGIKEKGDVWEMSIEIHKAKRNLGKLLENPQKFYGGSQEDVKGLLEMCKHMKGLYGRLCREDRERRILTGRD